MEASSSKFVLISSVAALCALLLGASKLGVWAPGQPPESDGVGAGSELIVVQSERCEAFGCEPSRSMEACNDLAGELSFKASVAVYQIASKLARRANAPELIPRGCSLSDSDASGEVVFQDHDSDSECSDHHRCLCRCPSGIDVALYTGDGASRHGYRNAREVLRRPEDGQLPIRVHLFSAVDFEGRLDAALYDVAFFPGGTGGRQVAAVGRLGTASLKRFLAAGGGYVGVCGGAYAALGPKFALSSFKKIPNLPDNVKERLRRQGNRFLRARGNVTVQLTEHGKAELAPLGVDPAALDRPNSPEGLLFFAGGPIMRKSKIRVPDVTDARILATFTRCVTVELGLMDQRPYSGKGAAAVVASTYAHNGTVVLAAPHPETDPLHWRHRKGPPAAQGSALASLLRGMVRLAAAPVGRGSSDS